MVSNARDDLPDPESPEDNQRVPRDSDIDILEVMNSRPFDLNDRSGARNLDGHALQCRQWALGAGSAFGPNNLTELSL